MKNADDAVSAPIAAAPPAPEPRIVSRRKFLRGVVAAGAVFALASGYATGIEPFWLDLHELPLPVRGLPPAFAGFRVAQVSDLHTGMAPQWYLERTIKRLNAAAPDLVLVTGDLTHHEMRFIAPAIELIDQIRAPKVVILGNHDYRPFDSMPGDSTVLADVIQREIARVSSCTLLRNRAMPLDRAGSRLWLVGLEDYWSDLFSAADAFAAVDGDGPRLVLSHNPDSIAALAPFRPTVIFSGHTHGGQVRLPLIGAPCLPVLDRRHDQGMFDLGGGTTLYVSRGVGYLHQIRFMCRPELPIFTLVPA
jgi:uncharacterized protein